MRGNFLSITGQNNGINYASPSVNGASWMSDPLYLRRTSLDDNLHMCINLECSSNWNILEYSGKQNKKLTMLRFSWNNTCIGSLIHITKRGFTVNLYEKKTCSQSAIRPIIGVLFQRLMSCPVSHIALNCTVRKRLSWIKVYDSMTLFYPYVYRESNFTARHIMNLIAPAMYGVILRKVSYSHLSVIILLEAVSDHNAKAGIKLHSLGREYSDDDLRDAPR